MPEYTKVWLPDFSNLSKEQTDQEKRVEARKQLDRLESGIVTANDKYTGTDKERYLKAKAKIDSKGRPIAGQLTPILDIVYAINPATSVLWAADEGSKALSSIPEAIKYKQYGAAIGGGLKAMASPIIGAFSFAPITQTATNAVKNYKAANLLSKTTLQLIKELNAAEIANLLLWQPKEGYYYHVARRSKSPIDSKFLDIDGFYRMGSKEVSLALEPLKSSVGEPLIYLQRETPRYYPEIFQNTDNVIYEIPAGSIGLENGALIEKLPKVDLSKATKYEFDLSSRSYKPSKILSNNSKLTEAERLGLPKGTKVYTPEENVAFRQQINDFASKYGYEPIGEEVTDPELLERYARSMIKRHNTFYRGVKPLKKESDLELWSLLESALGKNFTEELALKYMATHTPGESAGELYISPYSLVAGLYGHTVEVTRPFKLGTDRTKWFIEGDFPLVENAGHRNIKYYDHFSGLTDPWNMGELFGMSTGNISKGEALLWYKPSYYKPNTGGIPREVTARNLTLIPQRISYRASYGSRDWKLGNPDLLGSHKITDTPWQFTTITEKNGGKLNYTKFFK